MAASPVDWVRRRDPDLATVRRALRVTIAACVGFYLSRYLLGDRVTAVYALFTAIALGVVGRAAGSVRARLVTLGCVLPVGLALVALGTVLARGTVPATVGLVVVAFTISFASVGGPRFAGLAAGLQLLYVLACFPPYAPDTLGSRLAGVGLGLVLLAVAEMLIVPDPDPVPYRSLVADAADALAHHLDGLADAMDGVPPADLAERHLAAVAAGERLRPSRVPPGVVPAGPSRRDHALANAASTVRFVLSRADLDGDLGRVGEWPAAAAVTRPAANGARAGATALRGGPLPPALAVAPVAAADVTGRPGIGELAVEAVARTIQDGVRLFDGAVRVFRGAPAPEGFVTDPFWYSRRSTVSLWWHRLRIHLTPRSVYFQLALRTAAALGGARVIAGLLDLQHGFWVVLATLTVMRTSAAATRTAVVPAVFGTMAGAFVAAPVLMILGAPVDRYAIVTPVVMFAAFAGGVLFGQAVGQALFTLLVTVVFAQLSPSTWRLAEVRLVDVLAGAVVGILVGLAAWPRGAAGELREAVARLYVAGGRTVRETVDALDGDEPTVRSLPSARRAMQLADTAYAMYATERRTPAMSGVDWQAAIVTGHDLVDGAQLLGQSLTPVNRLGGKRGVATLEAAAAAIEAAYGAAADVVRLRVGGLDVPRVTVGVPPGATPERARLVVSVEVYLAALARDLARLTASTSKIAGLDG
ncbi:MAG TPA: FUSC family protein [Asanoa sp.]